MKQIIVRSAIVAFGIICLAVVCMITFIGDTNHYEELDSISDRIDADPTQKHLRDLLNCPADGAYAYYKIAIIGASFSNHPEVFQTISEDIYTDREKRSLDRLARLGALVFDQHPEIKPADFDQQFSKHTWLIQQHGE